MERKRKEWKLDDGSIWTTKSLSELVGCSLSSAYHRLSKTKDPVYVLRPIDKVKRVKGYKLYKLDDGSEWTAKQVAEFTGCPRSTASTRLSYYTDPAKVLAPPIRKPLHDKNLNKQMKKRMFFDPEGHWKLINSFT
jgi:hypothetical protein